MISQPSKPMPFLDAWRNASVYFREHKRKASLPFEPLDQYVQRKKKLAEVKALGDDPYPHKFEQTSTPAQLQAAYGEQ